MKRPSRAVCAAVAVLWINATAHAAQALNGKMRGDVTAGERFAATVCAECHAVGKAQARSPNPSAPTFPNIAASPGLNETAIRVWLQSPHPTMPNIHLSDEDKSNVVAYLLSLKPE